jgi:hypothetical protein
VVNSHDGPAAAGDDEERGSWHLRGVGAWGFALALWLAGLGGTVVFSQDGLEVGWARMSGVPGTVTIEKCAHSSSYALCYGPFDAADGSVHKQRLELRTIRHDRPGTAERTWLPSRSARHAWASDVNPWRQLLPTTPFALLAVIQTAWITMSWRAWRRRRRLRREAALPRPVGIAPPAAPMGIARPAAPMGIARPAAPGGTGAAPAPMITPSYQEHPRSVTVGDEQQRGGWQDLRGTAVPPGPSTPQSRARRQPWEISEHG